MFFNYTVRRASGFAHDPYYNEWHDKCIRYVVEYGTLNIFSIEDGIEYQKASYPSGTWGSIRAEVYNPNIGVRYNSGGLVDGNPLRAGDGEIAVAEENREW